MNYVNNIIALIGVVFVGFMPSLTFNIIFRTANLEDENFQDRYKTIINDMRLDNPLRFQFICVYLFRRAVYAGIFVFFVNSPTIQVVSAI